MSMNNESKELNEQIMGNIDGGTLPENISKDTPQNSLVNGAEELNDRTLIGAAGGSIFQKKIKGAEDVGLYQQKKILKGDRYVDRYTGENYSVKDAKQIVKERQEISQAAGKPFDDVMNEDWDISFD